MAKNLIQKIPAVPKEIIDAVNNENLAIFVGAGVSRLIGCEGWDELAQNLINRCFSTKKEDGSFCINFKEKEMLSQSKDHKKNITICHYILKRNGFENVFFEELNTSLKANDEILNSQNIYKELISLHGLLITTNADKYLDVQYEQSRIVYHKEDFTPTNIDRYKLYHIHGSIADKESLVFTVPQYIKRYNDPQFKEFLKSIFDKYVVLFVGYGMAEFELLDFLISKFDSNQGKVLKHFILSPFYKGEENILEFEQYYYNTMGISVLPYEKDERGYGQLYEVIRNWNSVINQTSTYLYNSYQELEDAANHFSENRMVRVLQIIKNDEPQENYFFKKLSLSSNPIPWLVPLKKRGYFSPDKNPSPQEVKDQEGFFTMPHWNVLGYLENLSTQNAQMPNDLVTYELLDIVNSVINYRDEKDERIENFMTDWVMVKIISALPVEKITKMHIDFIGIALRSKWKATLISSEISRAFLPRFLKFSAKEILLDLLDLILDYQEKPDGFGGIMEEYWLNKALQEYNSAIAKLCSIEAAQIAISKIKSIINFNKFRFNNTWIRTIEDHPQTSFASRYECQLVRFIRDMFEQSDPIEIRESIHSLLNEEHEIFKRIGIYIINFHYKKLNDLFWNYKGNLIQESSLKHEVFELIKQNSCYFEKRQINQLIHWIESVKINTFDDIDPEKVKMLVAFRKKEMLLALLETNDPDVIALYKKYNKVYSGEINHPGFSSWMEGWEGNISPIRNNELLNKSNEEIAKYLIGFREEKGWKKPSNEGLADTFRNCVIENPEKFVNDMKPFLIVQRSYQYSLLLGLSEAWRKYKSFSWNDVFSFINEIISSYKFWNEKYEKEHFDYRSWIISQITQLISEGTQNDNHAFTKELLPKAKNILLVLSERTQSNIQTNDLITAVLNSSLGQLYSTMMDYSLRYSRLYKREQKSRWDKDIKAIFQDQIDSNEPSLEVLVILGQYLPNVMYLDSEWLIKSFNRIFFKDNEFYWVAAFTGYLHYSHRVDKELYHMFSSQGHYSKALQTSFDDDHISERLVQHICVAYVEGWEKVDDENSLIQKLLLGGDVKKYSDVVRFFCMLQDKMTEKIKVKLKPVWKVLIEIASKNEQNKEYQKILSNLSGWLSLIDAIDKETFEWLKLSAKYIDMDYNSSFFVEYLAQHVVKTPSKVGDIFIEIIDNGYYPDFKEDDIKLIVQALYDQELNTKADIICNRYGARGYEFLRTIYEHNRSKTAN